MNTGRKRLSAACSLLAWATLLVIAPASAAQTAPPAAVPALTAEHAAEFSAKLGELLHNLDQDQLRRLTRAAKATTRYKPATLGQTADLLARHPDQVLVIFAKRRRPGQTRVDLESALLLPASGSPAVLSAKARARDAYVFNGPLDGTWNTLMARLGSNETVNVTRAQGLDALAKSRVAAFVFLLKTDATGQRTAQKLILVPDTIRINIGAEGAAGSFGDAGAGASSEEPYYDEAESVQSPEYELPAEEIPGPIEQSPEE